MSMLSYAQARQMVLGYLQQIMQGLSPDQRYLPRYGPYSPLPDSLERRFYSILQLIAEVQRDSYVGRTVVATYTASWGYGIR